MFALAGLLKFLTNPAVAIALAIAAGLWAFHEWDSARIEAKHQRAAAAARERALADNAEYEASAKQRDEAAREALNLKQIELDQAQAQINARRGKNVTPKNIAAVGVLPVGVIVQHNVDATGKAEMADRYAGTEEKPSGVGIDRYGGTVGKNYAAARKQDARYESLENRLIAECHAWNKKWSQDNYCSGDQAKPEGLEKKGR